MAKFVVGVFRYADLSVLGDLGDANVGRRRLDSHFENPLGISADTISHLCLQLVGRSAKNQIFFEISNGRLPLEDGSDRRETLAKRVSDDLQSFVFRHR